MDLHPGQAEVRPRARGSWESFYIRTGGAEPALPPVGASLFRDPLSKAFGNHPPTLVSCRELYSQFLREMIIQPGIAKANMGVSREDVTFEDHVSRGHQWELRLQSGEGCGLWSGQGPSP